MAFAEFTSEMSHGILKLSVIEFISATGMEIENNFRMFPIENQQTEVRSGYGFTIDEPEAA